MVSILLSINNNEESMELPVIPEKLNINSSFNNGSFNSMKQQLNVIGLRQLKPFDIQSFFPIRDYPFLRNRTMWGMEYVETIERWRDRRVPLRLIITNDDPNGFNLNMAVTIDSFEYGTGKSGDIDYKLSLREFVFVRVSG